MAEAKMKPREYVPTKAIAEATDVNKKNIKPVVKAPAHVQKKSGMRKLAESFMHDGEIPVKSRLINEIIVPGIRDFVVNVVTDAVNVIFKGERSAINLTGRSILDKISYTQYDKISDPRTRSIADTSHANTVGGYLDNDIIVNTKGEATAVLQHMDMMLEKYGIVSVADFNELVRIPGHFTDGKFGWTNLKNAEAVRLRDGRYLIKLPKAMPIEY